MRPTEGPPGEGPDLLAELARWAADERVRRGVAARARQKSLLEQSAGGAKWAGLMVDLVESGAEVTMRTVGGTAHSGRVAGLGRDFCHLARAGGRAVLVPVGAVTSLVRADPGPPGGVPAGDRSPKSALSFTAALDALASEHSPVRLSTAGGESVDGRIVAVGEDMATLTSPAGGRVHVPLSQVTACELR